MKQDGEQGVNREGLQGAALETALDELCDRKQSFLLATPYLTFESRFLERSGADLRVRATMSRNVVRSALDRYPLRVRVPWNLTMLGGPTRVLDYEDSEGAHFLRLAAPASLVPDDQRRAYRLEQVGRSTGALGSQDQKLVKVALETLTTLGLGVFCLDPLPAVGFQPGRSVDVSLSLEQGPQLQATCRICHGSGQYLGLAFAPPLAGPALEKLTAWLQPRLAEAQRHWDDRASLRSQAGLAARPKAPPEGVLLVSGDTGLHARLAATLQGVQPLRQVWPAMAPFSEAMTFRPPFVLVLALSGGLEEAHRLRALLEAAPPRCPVVALGVGADLDQTRAQAANLKATLFLDRKAFLSPFFPRLIVGLIRKHWPAEPGTLSS